MMKSNPLLQLNGMGGDFMHDAGFSDASEHTEDTVDSSSNTHPSSHKVITLYTIADTKINVIIKKHVITFWF